MVSWRQMIKERDAIIKAQEERICELEKRLLAYENAHTPPSLQRKKKKKPPINNDLKKLGAKKGHPKYERSEPEITGSIEYSEDCCPHCSNILNPPYKIERFIEEEIPEPQPIEVIEHLVHHYKCSKCKKKIIAKNNAPIGRFGKNAQTHITLLKFEDRLPLRKVTQSIERHYQLNLTHVGVYKVTKRVSNKLREPYYEVIKRIRSSKVLYIDETQYKLNGQTWWLWTFVSDHDTLFVIRKSRSKKVIEEILGKKFKGVISADGWSAYKEFTNFLQRCWAHLLRETKKMAEDHEEFIYFHNAISKLFDKIQSIRDDPPPPQDRIIYSEKMRLELKQIVEQMDSYKPFKKLATKIRNGLNYWFTCIKNMEVEPTNNYAEQALRELIVQRKIMGGLKAKKGAEVLETIATMIASWKKQGLSTFNTMKSHL
jgi:transposase